MSGNRRSGDYKLCTTMKMKYGFVGSVAGSHGSSGMGVCHARAVCH